MAVSRRTIGVVGLLGVAAAAALGVLRLSTEKPLNILLITLDTTRADRLGAYGYSSARTGVLDRLAREGVLFERASTPAPLTLPAHASLLTGLYPPEHGLRTNGQGRLPSDVVTLADLLSRAGYRTGAFVASFVLDAKFGLDRGFQTYDDDLVGAQPTQDALHRFRDGKLVVDAARDWLGQSRSRPFFCWVHLYDPHAPYEAHADLFGDDFAGAPYDAEIAYVDRQIGRLLDAVQRLSRTVVIVVGDHGEGLGDHFEREHGFTLYESTQHVPLIVHGVPDAAPGARIPTPVSLVDVLPTVTELLKRRAPEGISGRSFLAAIRGQSISPRGLYAATDDPFLQNGWSPLRSLTTERWKYIRTTRPELYDLQSDPREKRNLADELPEQVRELERQLADLEAALTTREAAAVRLSPAERRVLASLGYLGGASSADADAMAALPDVKDMLPFDFEAHKALDLLERGEEDEALALARKLVADAPPEHVTSRLCLGAVYERQGRLAEAEDAYRAVVEQRPEHVEGLFRLAGLYTDQGRYDEALPLYEKCQELNPESALPRFNLGLAHLKLGDWERARLYLEEALQLDPASPGVWAALGNLSVRQGNVAEAISAYEAELALNPTSVEAHVNLGAQLFGQGNRDDARRHFVAAIRLAPASVEAHLNLGICCAREGDVDCARTHFEEVLRLQPDHAQAAAELAQLPASR